MRSGEFTLTEFLSMLEDEHYRKRLFSKWRRGIRYNQRKRMGAKKNLQLRTKQRLGWGERKREVEDVAESCRLREY